MLESNRTYSDLVYFDISGSTGRSLLDLMFVPFLHKSELIKASSNSNTFAGPTAWLAEKMKCPQLHTALFSSNQNFSVLSVYCSPKAKT